MKCFLCNKEYKSLKSISIHLRHTHEKISTKKYYDTFLKKDNEGICYCGNITKFLNISKGYCKHCSTKCSSKGINVLDKKKKTCLKKYGVEHPLQNKDIKQKKKETSIKNYGVEHPLQNKDILNKRKNTCKKKYGVEHPSQNKDILNKIKNTCIKKYGVECSSKNEDVLQKKKDTCLKKYGVDNPSKNSQVKEKRKKIFDVRYGGYPGQNEKIKDKIKDTRLKNFIPNIKKLFNFNKLELITNYINNRNMLEVKCCICSIKFKTTVFKIQQGYGRCPNCYPKYKSIAEQEIVNFIKNLGFLIVENDKQLIKPLELDIYIPSKKIAIEYNGLYWHSEKRLRDKTYHLNKLNKCLEQNIHLIQIFEDEWILKKDIVKSRLKQILGINSSERIHARKCIIKEIDPKIKNDFLNKYHIQGKDNSIIKLGAFYSDSYHYNKELVSIMTFSKGSIAKGAKYKEGIWELNRFCSDSNFHIPGIASKLLAYFKRNYSWKEIFSYADRRWSTGNLYCKLGFILEYNTDPNYWYVRGLSRIHRFSLRKRPNEPKEIPEWFLRSKEGYTRIWDCGHLKFIIKGNNYEH